MENILSECSQQLHRGRSENRSAGRCDLAGTGCPSARAVRRSTVPGGRKLANRGRQSSVVGGGDTIDKFRNLKRRQPEFLPRCDELSDPGQTIYGAHLLG